MQSIQTPLIVGGVAATLVGTAVLTGGFVWYMIREGRRSRAKRQAADAILAAEHYAKTEECQAEIARLLGKIEEYGPAFFDHVEIKGSDLMYRPKERERILYVAQMQMGEIVEQVTGVQYGGLTAMMKIAGPLRLRAGSIALARHREVVCSDRGQGWLVVTNQRLMFNAAGSGKDWSRTWNSITIWGAMEDAVVVELGNGRPKLFVPLDPYLAASSPPVLASVFELAHEAK